MVFRFVIIALFVLCGTNAYAQNTFTVSGRLLDSETGEPLVFATVFIEGESIKTITNTLQFVYLYFDSTIPLGTHQVDILLYRSTDIVNSISFSIDFNR